MSVSTPFTAFAKNKICETTLNQLLRHTKNRPEIFIKPQHPVQPKPANVPVINARPETLRPIQTDFEHSRAETDQLIKSNRLNMRNRNLARIFLCIRWYLKVKSVVKMPLLIGMALWRGNGTRIPITSPAVYKRT